MFFTVSVERMAEFEWRKIDNLRHTDIVFGYVHRAQQLFPKNNVYYHLVDLIKHLCLLYYHSSFTSSILSEKECDEFLPQLKECLDAFSTLSEVDTTDTHPSFHPVPLQNALREDTPKDISERDGE